MRKWWITAAVAALLMGQSARAQSPGLPEPTPVAPCPPPPTGPAVPGPLSTQYAPPGPALDLSLPATIPTAWGLGPMPEKGFFLHLGAQALQRQRPGRAPFVLVDPNNNLDNGNIPLLRDTFVGRTTGDIRTEYGWGVRATVGYLYDDAALEVTGFYTPENKNSTETAFSGRLLGFFQNPPLGFEGDNGMWLQADRAVGSVSSTLGNVELNYRWWARSHTGLEGIIGIRYLDVVDQASLFFDDDGVTVLDVNGNPDPLRQAEYTVTSHNRILGPQFGFESFLPIFSWLSFGVQVKGMWGVNFTEDKARIARGDGYVGRQGKDSDVIFSQLYEVGAYYDFVMFERIRLRAGYQGLWVLGVHEGFQQVSYDLSRQPGPIKDDGSIFYHGPVIEFQFIF